MERECLCRGQRSRESRRGGNKGLSPRRKPLWSIIKEGVTMRTSDRSTEPLENTTPTVLWRFSEAAQPARVRGTSSHWWGPAWTVMSERVLIHFLWLFIASYVLNNFLKNAFICCTVPWPLTLFMSSISTRKHCWLWRLWTWSCLIGAGGSAPGRRVCYQLGHLHLSKHVRKSWV